MISIQHFLGCYWGSNKKNQIFAHMLYEKFQKAKSLSKNGINAFEVWNIIQLGNIIFKPRIFHKFHSL